MSLRLATVRDSQSAEHLKTLALARADDPNRLALWRQARRLDPGNSALVSHEALALFDRGEHRAVIALLTPAIQRWPRHSHLVNLMGVALFNLGHMAAAERLFAHCLELDPHYPAGTQNLHNARAGRGKSRAAPRGVDRAIDAALEAAATLRRPTLAVCMIVRDEAEFIVDALRSVVDVADELIVVDTGSLDETVALCRAEGARVELFEWTGSFAEARNASLDYATADWILALDADERLTPSSRTTIRAILEEYRDGELRVICPHIKNYTRAGRLLSDGFSGRLFLNHPKLRFKGRVHEEVGRGVPGLSTDYRLDLEFDHYGYAPEVMRSKDKDRRNIELLEGRLAEEGDDLLTWFYLASQHWAAHRIGDARRCFERVVTLFERNPSAYGMAIRNVPVPYSYVGLTRTLRSEGDAVQAVEAGKRGLARFPDNPDLWFHTAFGLIDAGRRDEARGYLERAQHAEVAGYALIGMQDRSIGAWRARKALADLDFEGERPQAAYEGYLEVLDALPEDDAERIVVGARLVELAAAVNDLDRLPELARDYATRRPSQVGVACQVAQVLTAEGRLQVAYDLLTGLYEAVEAVRESEALCVTVARVAVEAGEDAEALAWYQRAMDAGCREPRAVLELAQVLLRNGQQAAAAEVFELARALVAGAPAQG